MRERFLEVFDAIRIDCLNGDKYKTGKVAPDGSPDPSIFSTESNRVGIQVGTAIATLVRKSNHVPAKTVGFRHLWGQAKREQLTATAEADPENLYENVEPILPLGLPFVRTAVSKNWFDWPSLPDIFSKSFPGVTTNRDAFLVDIDLGQLRTRIKDYFDSSLSHEEIGRRYPVAMKETSSIKATARQVREKHLTHVGWDEAAFIRYTHRPFDNRWIYWQADSGLLARPSPAYRPHVFDGNLWLEARQRESREVFSRGTLTTHIAGDFGNGRSHFFPAYICNNGLGSEGNEIQCRPNLSGVAQRYLQRLGMGVEDLFHHVLATLHDPVYREANAGALRMEWPRIPLLGWPDGEAGGAAESLAASAARGRELVCLLDSEAPVPGVTQGALRPEIAALAVPATTGGHNMTGDDFALTMGWGHFGQGSVVMPGRGHVVDRPYTPEERAALGDTVVNFNGSTFDIYLNDHAYWRNVPASVWNYKLGGYQVLKKWLSYRESDVLGRALSPSEVQHFADTARRIAAIILLTSSSLS